MTTATMSVEEKRKTVAARFLPLYYTRLTQDPASLAALYLPTATFNHPKEVVKGAEKIPAALRRVYGALAGEGSGAHVVLSSIEITGVEGGRFVISVGGTLHRNARDAAGERFHHLLEMHEHAADTFGIYSDSLTFPDRAQPKQWALETPPMFAREPQAAAAAELPELVQPPTTAAPEPAAPAAPAAEEKKAPAAEVAAAAPAVAAAAAEEEAPAKGDAEAAKPAAKEEAKPAAASGEKLTFAEMMKARKAASAATTAAPVTVVAAAPKEDKKKPAAPAATTPAAAAPKAEVAAAAPKAAAKPASTPAAAAATGAAAAAGAPASSGSPPASGGVIFYNAIVKGLPKTADEAFVREMMTVLSVPTRLVKLRSQPDKKDASIIRTFAFVQFDGEALAAQGATVAQTLVRVRAAAAAKYGAQRIEVDEVREKFTNAFSRTGAPASSGAAAATAPAKSE